MKTSSPTREGTGLIAALQRATHVAGRRLEHELAGVEVGQAEAHVLAHLARSGTGTIAELHRGFGHRRSTLTSLLDRLEARGWVTRSTDRTDRRSVRLTLTPRGRRVARCVAAAVGRVEARVAGQVPHDALRGFHKTVAALDKILR